MSERTLFALNFAYNYVMRNWWVGLGHIDIDELLSLAVYIAQYGTYNRVDMSMFTELKRLWIKLVDDYRSLDMLSDSGVREAALQEVLREYNGQSSSPVEAMARMVVAYDSYCKFIDMTFRCSKDTYLNTHVISDYVKNEVSGGYLEVNDMVTEIHKAFHYEVPLCATAKSMQDACQEVFLKCIGQVNVGHRQWLLSGECQNIKDACDRAIAEAADRANEMLNERTMYIEDISTALNQMKILIELIRSWSDRDKAPWFKKTEFGYVFHSVITGKFDEDFLWHTAMQKLTMWGIFAEWVYGMNDTFRYYLVREGRVSYADVMDICESLYVDVVNTGNEWLKTAKHKQRNSVSALLSMAEGK